MKTILSRLLGRAGDLVAVQPVIALFIGAALLAVFLATMHESEPATGPESKPGLVWLLYRRLNRSLWALTLVGVLIATLSLLRGYLHQTLASFQRSHGRVTEANYHAVQTIWGAEQVQGELQASLFYEEEVTERIESEDLTKPAVLRKKVIRHDLSPNPFIFARHEVTLRQNPRKKGSALYGGYETVCRFQWGLKNSADRDLNSVLKFPLPAAAAMYNDLTATLDGKDVLPQMQLKEGALLLTRDWKANQVLDLAIAFTSRGMSSWYFQVREPREIRDFTLTLTLPDVSKGHLNNPEGCMTPTETAATADNQGSVLTYRLDHAISNKGMGIALPTPPQPGAATNAVLAETERGWLLLFAMLVLGLTVAAVSTGPTPPSTGEAMPTRPDNASKARLTTAVMLSILGGATTACGYGMLADFSDLLFGFWVTAALVLVPMFLVLAWLLMRAAPFASTRLLAVQLFLYGIIYPALAGLDSERQSLYFNVCALAFLAFAAWQLACYRGSGAATQEKAARRPAGEGPAPSVAASAVPAPS